MHIFTREENPVHHYMILVELFKKKKQTTNTYFGAKSATNVYLLVRKENVF